MKHATKYILHLPYPHTGDPSVDSPAPPQDADEKLIFDAHAMTVAAIEKIVS